MKINNLLLSIFFVILISGCVLGYGEGDKDGHPTYIERTSLLVVNMARNNPHAFSNTFMSSFNNYSTSGYSNIYQYPVSGEITYYIPKAPLQYNNGLNRLANGYLQMYLDTPGCNITNLQFCNGTSASVYLPNYYNTTLYTAYFDSSISYSVGPGYGKLMSMICDEQVNGSCAIDNLNEDYLASKPRYSLLHQSLNQFGSASTMINGVTYMVVYLAQGPSYYESSIAGATHLWMNSNDYPTFYLTFYEPGNYALSVSVSIGGQNYTLSQYYMSSSYLYDSTSPYSTYYLNYLNDVSECDTYNFYIKTYSGETIRYPSKGYLSLAKESSTCDAWTTVPQGVSSSSTITYSLSLLLFIITLNLII